MPSDSEMLLATLKMERKAQLAVPPLPSTFAVDVAAITGALWLPDHAACPFQGMHKARAAVGCLP